MANKSSSDRAAEEASFQLFNLETMSGVFPGTRTARFQRIRLQRVDAPDEALLWARILWYDEPQSCVVMAAGSNAGGDEAPVLRLPEPDPMTLFVDLRRGLAAAGYQYFACSQCSHWHPAAGGGGGRLVAGACARRSPDQTLPASLESLTLQSGLALACLHFVRRAEDEAAPPVSAPASVEEAAEEVAALPRAAVVRKEQEASARSWRSRFLGFFHRTKTTAPSPSWMDQVMERSGVGAGTEPCFACQGRLANLGALTVASPEEDKQTYSVWRCRLCYTFYLNRWIDRWERLDTLETDETYWRIAPAEALALLEQFASIPGGDHPQGRHAREAERARMEAFTAERTPLSRQVKLGR